MKNPFKRTKLPNNAPDVPKELKDYYGGEKRNRRGLTWLVGFASLLVTAAVVTGLFFAGRWAFRKLDEGKTPQTATTQNAPQSSQNTTEQKSSDTPSDDKDTNDASDANEGTVDDEAATTDKSNDDLPATGPASTMSVFVLTVLVATALHTVFSRRQRNI